MCGQPLNADDPVKSFLRYTDQPLLSNLKAQSFLPATIKDVGLDSFSCLDSSEPDTRSCFRIQTVKQAATRAAKIRQFVEMLGRNERIHEVRESRGHSKESTNKSG